MPNVLEHKTYQTEDGIIHYWTSGVSDPTGRTLVFLPGLTADHRLFDRQMEYFAGKPGMRCLVWDGPSHGLSRPFPLTWSLDDLARMLDGLLEQEGVERPVLIGQSLGGYVAQAYMDLFPGKAAGFVSIDSAPLQREYITAAELFLLKHTHAMYASIPWNALKRFGAQVATSGYGMQLMRTMMDDYEKPEYVDLTAHGFRALAEAIEASRPYVIDCPALLICGEKDKAGSAMRYNRAWAKRTGLPLKWIAGAGHNANTDAPDEVNGLIGEFAESLRTLSA